jgi:hypothetical protein
MTKKKTKRWKLKRVTSIGVSCKTCGRPIAKEDIEKYISSQQSKSYQQARKDVLKEIEGMKLKMTKKERKLAKEIGCLACCDDQVFFYNQAISDIQELLKKKD